jgi:hypothetical protein
MKDIKLDDRISALVRSVELDVPDGLEDKALEAARTAAPRPGARPQARPFRRWPALIPAAALAFAAFLLVLPALRRPPASPSATSATTGLTGSIAEIRTEFELPDKNIKIIFFQKPDFNLFKEN